MNNTMNPPYTYQVVHRQFINYWWSYNIDVHHAEDGITCKVRLFGLIYPAKDVSEIIPRAEKMVQAYFRSKEIEQKELI